VNNKGDEVDPHTVDWSKYKKGIPFNVVQGSGDENALGILKFNFPNKYDVYLHDTNQRYLFARNMRSLSHGCVRVQEWEKLAYNIVRFDNQEKYPETVSPTEDSLKVWLKKKRNMLFLCARSYRFLSAILPVKQKMERWCFMMTYMEKIKHSRKNSSQVNELLPGI
jgi:murein L,D-transpeptidase YcbB/YkuD